MYLAKYDGSLNLSISCYSSTPLNRELVGGLKPFKNSGKLSQILGACRYDLAPGFLHFFQRRLSMIASLESIPWAQKSSSWSPPHPQEPAWGWSPGPSWSPLKLEIFSDWLNNKNFYFWGNHCPLKKTVSWIIGHIFSQLLAAPRVVLRGVLPTFAACAVHQPQWSVESAVPVGDWKPSCETRRRNPSQHW